MAATLDDLQGPYLDILDLAISDHIKLYNKAIVGLPESDGFDLTRSKWNDFTTNWMMLYLHLDSNQQF